MSVIYLKAFIVMDNDEDRFELEVQREEWLLDTEEQEVFREWLEQLENDNE